MKKNMGKIDRRIRAFLIAPLLVVLALFVVVGSVGGVILLVLALVMLATSAAGLCPLYLPMGVDTHVEGEAQ